MSKLLIHERVALSRGIFVVLFLLPLPAFGTLGEDVSSVRSDQAHMKAAVRVLPNQLYSVHEMQAPTGTKVREFVSPAGTVFGISWQGFAPDLRQLLGEHFDEYVQAARNRSSHRGRGLHIETGDMVFDSGGHMRFIIVRAYLRSKMPQGVSSDDIR